MNDLRDFAAFQGTGMVGQSVSFSNNTIVRDTQFKSIEYRVGEILRDGGFPENEAKKITSAIMYNIKLGLELTSDNLSKSFREFGIEPKEAKAISDSIAAGVRR